MKSCKEYDEKIIFFDDLDESEKRTVQEHLEKCKNCRAHFEKVRIIMSSLKKGIDAIHLSNESLARFTIYAGFRGDADYDGEKLSTNEAIKIRKHLNVCYSCNKRFNEMKAEFESIESYLKESEIAEYKFTKNQLGVVLRDSISAALNFLDQNWKMLIAFHRKKLILVPAVLTILILLFVFRPFFKGNGNIYRDLARLDRIEISYLIRGNGGDYLQSGILEFNEGNYLPAAKKIEQFIMEQPNDPNRAFAEYACGLAYLSLANKNLNDLTPNHYQYIEDGIQHLQTALSLTNNMRIQEDANWYLGKAYLMKKSPREAIEFFKKAQSMKGRRYQRARNILKELQNTSVSSK